MSWQQNSSVSRDITSDVQHSYHPRCRRPARGQVFLKTLRVDGDSFSFTLPSACFTLRPSPNPRVIFASDRRADGEMSGIRLALPGETGTLITTATWQVNVPERPPLIYSMSFTGFCPHHSLR